MENEAPREGETPSAIVPSSDDRNMAALMHVSGIFFSALVPFLVWFMKKDDSPYLATQSKEALNFQITMLIAHAAAGTTVPFLVGFALLPAVVLVNILFCIVAAMKTSTGVDYRYPFSIRLVR